MTYIRKVLGFDGRGRPEYGGPPIMCAWSDCTEYAHQEYRIEQPDGENRGGRLVHAFCCDQHKRYYLNGPRHLNMLPASHRATPGVLR